MVVATATPHTATRPLLARRLPRPPAALLPRAAVPVCQPKGGGRESRKKRQPSREAKGKGQALGGRVKADNPKDKTNTDENVAMSHRRQMPLRLVSSQEPSRCSYYMVDRAGGRGEKERRHPRACNVAARGGRAARPLQCAPLPSSLLRKAYRHCEILIERCSSCLSL
jgi:hypothetical protein